ncbi:thioredoxin family protein [Ilyobacter polytropus]|uniref:Redox-active disulfide protein 2 n=1 Tax=Ilyobacter polytropus (strain ATCC 51220 / DSM 2926 / LMG 16218 / CuHBu1) TaxID=572544 RepID=E3HCD2_ILYPC|nr:thioredoxin family protein [Ilyobacter polytropus]ADO84392.1 redox-active disulfide protein 2 [Ilyobacter polytropus DSM 2926]
MDIKILGTGCKKCNTLTNNVKEAISETTVEASIEKVEDMKDIMGYGVMSTPAVVIDGKVVSTGRVLSVDEVKKLIKE